MTDLGPDPDAVMDELDDTAYVGTFVPNDPRYRLRITCPHHRDQFVAAVLERDGRTVLRRRGPYGHATGYDTELDDTELDELDRESFVLADAYLDALDDSDVAWMHCRRCDPDLGPTGQLTVEAIRRALHERLKVAPAVSAT